jgi:hypothetical protein
MTDPVSPGDQPESSRHTDDSLAEAAADMPVVPDDRPDDPHDHGLDGVPVTSPFDLDDDGSVG